MATPILTTKLYVPPLRSGMVHRSRLTGRLNAGLTGKITLISAPAGFGKTTLVSEWLEASRRPSAWLSLDERDNDLARFLAYLLAAFQTVAPDIGAGLLDLLQTAPAQSLPTESILTALLNEIATHPTAVGAGVVLVLDDYHVIEAQPVDEALAFLVEHMPPQLHLMITTREDPSLPLARLRARGQLTELRAADLRFTAAEAAEFLNRMMGLSLAAADISVLEARTEGWIAGLQLAALSMQHHQDVPGFIKAFAGDSRYIADYLVEEVLQHQPESVRHFLLQTAILDRLTGPLCDAVTGQRGGQAQLEALERSNFFVVPLDDKRHWLRYHHLFAEVLRVHLLAEQPDQVSLLHRRASVWYEHNGSAAEAIRHALAAGDFERAADLIELALPALRQSRQEATLLGWLQALPEELFRRRPVLSVHYAGVLLQNGRLAGVEARLRDAEHWLDPLTDRAELVVVDEADFRSLRGSVAMYRAAIALVQGDLTTTETHARRALDFVPEDDYFRRGAAAAILGLACGTRGDLEAAYQSFAAGMAHLQRAGYISDAIGGSIALADIRLTQGRLHEAMRIYEQGLQLALEHGEPTIRGTADMHVGLSDILRERNDLPAAVQHLQQSQEQGEHTGFPRHPYRWRVALAQIRAAQGNLDDALDLLHEAERRYVSDFHPNVRPIAALVARVWLAQGRWSEALDWAREQDLSAQDDLSYLREFEHITLARLLLARYQRDRTDSFIREATGLLERLLAAAEAGGRLGSAIEILVLQALTYQAWGDDPAALGPLERALNLAEPEGYIRIFLDEGPEMARLLRAAAARGIKPDYTGKLLAAFAVEPPNGEGEPPLPAAPQPLVEPLSQRELEVLRLFKTELSGPEIAQELVIGLSTLRTHTKNIYSKLNVNNRRAAVNRAVELGLI